MTETDNQTDSQTYKEAEMHKLTQTDASSLTIAQTHHTRIQIDQQTHRY